MALPAAAWDDSSPLQCQFPTPTALRHSNTAKLIGNRWMHITLILAHGLPTEEMGGSGHMVQRGARGKETRLVAQGSP